MKLVVTPPALAELHDAAAFYTLKANVEIGLAFVAEFERTANLVQDTLILQSLTMKYRRSFNLLQSAQRLTLGHYWAII